MVVAYRRVIILSPPSVITKYVEDLVKLYFDEVLLMSSIEEALKHIETYGPPDLIIGSYVLSDGTLIDLLEAIRLKNLPRIPLVVITSEDRQEVIKRLLELGALDVVHKSILKEKLEEFIQEFTTCIDFGRWKGRVVCVEDSKVYVEFLKQAFQNTGVEAFFFSRAEEAYEFLQREEVDLVVVDYLLEGSYTGLDLIRKIRRSKKGIYMPIMVITAFDDPQRRFEIFKAGADDYIIKPFSREELLIRAYNLMAIRARIKELKEELEEAKKLFLKDPLTGAYNRNVFEFLEKELEFAKRQKHPITLAMMDIDHFKALNDKYGHLFGDKVLQAFAGEVMKNIRKTDYLIRYGGEEFMLVLVGVDLEGGFRKVEELRKRIESLSLDGVKFTFSAGIVCSVSGYSLKELIEKADEALYRAKQAGRNRVEVYKGS